MGHSDDGGRGASPSPSPVLPAVGLDATGHTAGGQHPSSADPSGQPDANRTTSRRIGRGAEALYRRQQVPVDHLAQLIDRVEVENDPRLPAPPFEFGHLSILFGVDAVRDDR